MLCCYVETDPKPIEERLFKSASIFGIYPIAIGKGELWEGFTTKLKLYKEFLKTRSEKFVLGTDARDVLYFNSKTEILNRFLKYYARGHKLVYNAETNCFPNKILTDKHPCQVKKYKFLNVVVLLVIENISLRFLSYVKNMLKKKKVIHKQDDQELIQHIFTDNIKRKDYSIWLDYDCNIFQVLWDENGGRSANFDIVYNKNYIHNTYTNISMYNSLSWTTGHGETVWKILNKKF